MIKTNGLIQDSGKTSSELLEHCKISKTTPQDLFEMARILCNNMDVNDPIFAFRQLIEYNVDLNESIKLFDERDGKIYGILVLASQSMNRGTPINIMDNVCAKVIKKYNQINGFLFIIDERLRGHGFDRKMIDMAMDYINTFDLVWAGVDKSLKTHNYWKHMGMYEVLNTNEAIFYCKILNKKILFDIYKEMTKKYESNHNRKC